MQAKLTLRLDGEVIKIAKNYAKENETSLSLLVESYFRHFSQKNRKDRLSIKPLTASLSGVMKKNKVNHFKKEYTDYLIEKYK